MELLKTPLHTWHVAEKAKMGAFAGWDMPIQYKGILAEHQHTRTKASVFDICHMGVFSVKGDTAEAELALALTHNFSTLKVEKCRYGFLLNEKAGVLDDLIVYKMAENDFLIVVNAACREQDFQTLASRLKKAHLEDLSSQKGKIDIQGPLACKILEDVLNITLKDLPYFSLRNISWQGNTLTLSRTGYTGELGYELYPNRKDTLELWNLLLSHPDVEPAGLGARDTLRLEAGLPLYGHELDTEHTPAESGFSSMLTSTAKYVGCDKALEIQNQVLISLIAEGRRAARNHDGIALESNPNKIIGTITSGSFAPTLNASIAYAFIDKAYATETNFILKAQKTDIPAQKTDLPFYKAGTARIKF